MPDLDGANFASLVRSLSRVGNCLDKRAMGKLYLIEEVFTRLFAVREAEFLVEFADGNILNFFSCDGWSRFLRTTDSTILPHATLTRKGKFRHDFTLQRGMYKGLDRLDNARLIIRFSQPISLKYGKDQWHFFTALCKFAPSLRQLGHKGWIVNDGCYDGPLHSTLSRSMTARTRIYYRDLPPSSEDDLDLLEAMEWDVHVKCCHHSANNGVKHATDDFLQVHKLDDKEVFIVIASARNSASELLRHCQPFVAEHLVFREDDSSEFERREFWHFFQIPDAFFFNEFVTLNPYWDGTRLHVSNEFELDDNIVFRVVCIVKFSIHFTTWSITRWVGAGPSSRKWLLSQVCGLDGLVDYCRLQGVDQSYMGGHSRATPLVRRFLVVVAVLTYPMEMLQLEMFHDNRFMRRIEYLKSVVVDEVDYIFGLSYYTWSRLADVVGFNVDFVATLRRDSSGAMLHAVTYNNTHSFRQFEQSPFKFAIGDIPRNVAQIRTLVTPIECPVVSKARFCLDKGLHQNGLIRQFRNIAEIPCDSGDVEKRSRGRCQFGKIPPTG